MRLGIAMLGIALVAFLSPLLRQKSLLSLPRKPAKLQASPRSKKHDPIRKTIKLWTRWSENLEPQMPSSKHPARPPPTRSKSHLTYMYPARVRPVQSPR